MSVLPVANDKVQLTSSAGTNYQNGVLMSGASAVYATSSPSVWSNGIYRTADGAIYVFNATAGMPSGFTWSNGLPFSALGALCVSTNAVASWSNGIPFDANGAVVADFGMPVPALSLDFTSGILDSRITFTRASGATYTDSYGVLQLATSNTPRFDYDPVTLQPKGLLIEEQRTNTIRNNSMVGAVAGTPGTLPTNWGGFTSVNGISREVVGTGTENGVQYIDIRFYGTPTTGNQYCDITFETNAPTAESGKSWTLSSHLRLVAGSFAGISPSLIIYGQPNYNDNASVSISGVSGSSLISQRFSVTRVFTDAATTSASARLALTVPPATAINFTIRIGLPQLEQGAFATSPIPTSGAQATRAADVATMTGTNFSSWYNQSEGTVYAEYDINYTSTAVTNDTVVAIDDGTSANRHELRRLASGFTGNVIVTGGVVQVNQTDTAPVLLANTVRKSIAAYKLNDVAETSNGLTPVVDTVATIPVVSQLKVGSSATSGLLNGHIKALAYYNTRLSNTQLQTLTT